MEKPPSDNLDDEIVNQLTEIQLSLRLYVQSLMPGDAIARDVAQQANATIWKKRSDFSSGTNFKAWAFSIARFEVLNFRKRQARDARLVFSDELEETFAEELIAKGDEIDVRQVALGSCLEALKAKDRELLLHRYSKRGTLKEFAAQTGRSAGGLKVTLFRLRSALLKCVEGQLNMREGQAGG